MAKGKKSVLPLVKTERQRFEILLAGLRQEWSTHRTYWRDLLDYVNPQRGRFVTTDAGKGTRKNQKIINSRASDNLTILKAGMMATITNPSTQWVKLSIADKVLAEEGEVKEWLAETSIVLHDILRKSNLYRHLPIMYGDMACVGIGALLVEEDYEDVIRTYPIPVGSYMVDVDDRGKVNTYAREFRYTVYELVKKFGTPSGQEFNPDMVDWSIFSKKVKDMWDAGHHLEWVDVVHMIAPNMKHDPSKLDAEFKKFSSVYFERGSTGVSSTSDYSQQSAAADPNKFLRKSGLDLFNILAPRWETTGEDAYGTNCPAMKVHGDNRALQTMEKRKAQAVELQVNPPLLYPVELKKKKNSSLAGSKVWGDVETMRAGGVKRLYDVDFKTGELREDIQDTMERVDAAFHRDAFAPISGQPIQGTPPSAAEVNQRVTESRLKMLGAHQNIKDDALVPLIDLAFEYAYRQDKIPEPPESLEDQELKVEFIGVLAQSQKAIALGSLREFVDFSMQVAQIEPTVMDKIDTDQLIDEYAEGAAINDKVIITDEEVFEKRMEAQQAAQAQAQQEQMMNMASTAKDLSQADLDGNNALSAVAEGMSEGV